MPRKSSFTCAILLLLSLLLVAEGATSARRPNIVVVLVDDLGYGDLGCTGSRQVLSPHIDRLAAQGVFCERAYAAAPMCAPSRMAMMTGRQPKRYGITANPNWKHPDLPESAYGLPADEKLIPQYLKPLGYTCALFGKWHLGHCDGQRPEQRGFDVWWGFLGGSRHFFAMEEEAQGLNPGQVVSNYDATPQVTYLTDDLTREAVRFIQHHTQHRPKDPFFMLVSYNAPHSPWESLATDREMTRKHAARQGAGEMSKTRLSYCAMIYAVDRGVGQICEALHQGQIAEKTLIFLMSDNVGAPEAPCSNHPWRGSKRLHYEGGVRVPMIVSCCARTTPDASPLGHLLPVGKRCDAVVSLMDVLPTILAINGQPLPPNLDGQNMLPLLRGVEHQPRVLHWCTDATDAIMVGDYKLLRAKGFAPRLFCLTSDPQESCNIEHRESTKAAQLGEMLDVYLKSTPKPRYPDAQTWGDKLLREHATPELSAQP